MVELRGCPEPGVLDAPTCTNHLVVARRTQNKMRISKAIPPAAEAQSHHLSRRLHALPEAEIQDDDDDHQTEQQLPLGQADVMDPTALMQMKNAPPVSRKEDSVREDGQVPRDGDRTCHSAMASTQDGLLECHLLALRTWWQDRERPCSPEFTF